MKTYRIEEKEQIEGIISKATICFIGINIAGEAPYVIPMNFGYENGTFYLHSGLSGRKNDLLSKDNRVCLTLNTGEKMVYQHPDVACSYSMLSQSVMCTGKACRIENYDEKVDAINIIMRHYTGRNFKYSIPAINNVCVWKIIPEEISCKSFGNSAKNHNT